MDDICNDYGLNNYFLHKTSIKYNNFEFTVPVCAPCPNGTTIVLNDREGQKCYFGVFDAYLIYFVSHYLWWILGIVAISLLVLSVVSILVRQIREQRRYMNPVKGFKFEKVEKRVEKIPKRYEIHKDDLEYHSTNLIGKGAFGRVYKGIWIHNGEKYKVAVKQITDFSNFQDKHEERQLLFHLKHDHIVQFIGVCVKNGNVKIITAYRGYGSLQKLLTTPEHCATVEPSYLIAYCHQIAKAMDYLAKKGIVHCDLATRNVLVRHLMHVEICDFGMAQALGSTVLQQQMEHLALEWLAIELLNPNEPVLKYTVATDVWAYGVTMWEIFTLCQEVPYKELNLHNIEKKVGRRMLYGYLNNDKFLEKPKICRQTLRDLMLCCWDEPRKRSSFHYFVKKFEGYLKNTIDMYIDLDEFANKPEANGQIIGVKSVAGNHFVLEKASTVGNNRFEGNSFSLVQVRQPNINPTQALLYTDQSSGNSCPFSSLANSKSTNETDI
ncbi:Receptor tyrosine-protein kinase let-23 [Aphelenchoides bicaudatus]|nr:Receptor tyrosine-protein kinase let-23 [Aphelenchoides bicaudatus]